MNIKQLNNLVKSAEQQRKLANQLITDRGDKLKKLVECREVIPQPKGKLWFRKCPWCGAHVIKEKWDYENYVYSHYMCEKCEYEYATRSYNMNYY